MKYSAAADGRGEPEASRTFCAYLMESALQKLPPGGETVLGIFDFQGAGAQNIDLDFAKFLVRLTTDLAVSRHWVNSDQPSKRRQFNKDLPHVQGVFRKLWVWGRVGLKIRVGL